jgi:hypothetical protein
MDPQGGPNFLLELRVHVPDDGRDISGDSQLINRHCQANPSWQPVLHQKALPACIGLARFSFSALKPALISDIKAASMRIDSVSAQLSYSSALISTAAGRRVW